MANNVPFKPNSSLEVNGPIEFLKGTVTESNTTFDQTGNFIFNHQLDLTAETNSFVIAGSGTYTYDIFFKPDGTAFFVLAEDDIKKWDLSTAWDISTATYNHAQSITGIGTLTSYYCMVFSPDGTTLILGEYSGSASKNIVEFSLSTAWDVSTATAVIGNVIQIPNTGASVMGPQSMAYNNDGSKIFVWAERYPPATDAVYSYALTTNYTLDTSGGAIVRTTEIANTSSYLDPRAGCMRFNNDGTKVFFLEDSPYTTDDKFLASWNLTTPYDIAGAGIESGPAPAIPDDVAILRDILGLGSSMRSMAFSSDGTKIYFLYYARVYEYDIGGKQYNLDLSTGNYFEVDLDADSNLVFDNARDVDLFSIKVNGVSTEGYGTVASNFSTSFNLNSLISFSAPWGFDLIDDGTKLYIYDVTDEQVKYISLSTPYDVGSGSFSYQNFTSTSASGLVNFRSLTVRDSGTKMHLTTGTTVNQWTLNTPYSLSSTTYNGSITPTSSRAGWNIFWNNDGTRLYSSSTTGSIQQMDLSTAYDITSTVTDSGISPTMTRTPYGMDLDETGTYLYYVTNINNDQIIYRATLSTPYDITTLDWATEVEIDLSTTFGMPSSSNFTGVRVVDGGKKVVVLDNSYDVVRVFNTLATPSITLSPNVNVLGTQTSVTNESSARYTFSTKNGGKTFIGTQTGTDFS